MKINTGVTAWSLDYSVLTEIAPLRFAPSSLAPTCPGLTIFLTTDVLGTF